MAHAQLPVIQRGFGETYRRDAWWLQPVVVFLILGSFVVYATWAAFQNAHYTFGPYLSPFYAPELWGDSPHAWFGPKPGWWPAWLPFSPALLILPFPGLFRFTCYYYRGAYYKAFWADPPSCAVGEPRKQRAAAPIRDLGELDDSFDERLLADGETADRLDRRAVLVALRQQTEQIADRANVEPRQALGDLRTDARQALDRPVE